MPNFLRKLRSRLKLRERVNQFFRKVFHKNKKLKNDFTIIASNCVGGMIYHDLNFQFLTPTVNLYFSSLDFLKFCLDLKHYLSCELIEDKTSGGGVAEYPVGILDDIKIFFVHYKTFEEAKSSWERRKLRINYDKIFVIMGDRDNFKEEYLALFDKIPYKKVLFSHKYIDNKDVIWFKKYQNNDQIGIVLGYYGWLGLREYEHYFDVQKWLTGNYDTQQCSKNPKK